MCTDEQCNARSTSMYMTLEQLYETSVHAFSLARPNKETDASVVNSQPATRSPHLPSCRPVNSSLSTRLVAAPAARGRLRAARDTR
jgi:hypothetical protein